MPVPFRQCCPEPICLPQCMPQCLPQCLPQCPVPMQQCLPCQPNLGSFNLAQCLPMNSCGVPNSCGVNCAPNPCGPQFF